MTQRRLPTSFIGRFFLGATYPVRGIKMIRRRRVLALTIAPFLISLALYVLVAALLVALGGKVPDLIVEAGSWWRSILRFLIWVAMTGLFVIVFVFTYSLTALAIAAPFYEFLSAAVERLHTGAVNEAEAGFKEMLIDIWRAVTEAVKFILMALVLCVFVFIFPPVTTAVAFLLTAVLVGLEFMEGPMGRRRRTFRDKLAYARRHLWTLVGFGSLMTVAMLMPLLGAAFLPLGVIGGTMMFCDLEGCEESPGDAGQCDGVTTSGKTSS